MMVKKVCQIIVFDDPGALFYLFSYAAPRGTAYIAMPSQMAAHVRTSGPFQTRETA
jgi:hypothetical protein